MTFIREELEHAYTTTRRLRARLAALARLAGAPAGGEELATLVATEAVTALGASACVLTRCADAGATPTLASYSAKPADAGWVEREAARMARETAAAGESLARPCGQGNEWSYLGVTLTAPTGEAVGVAGVFGDASRHFNEEDCWWLKAAAQPLVAALHASALERRVRELEGAAGRAGADASGGGAATRALSVLVVDDDRAVNDLLCELVKAEGYRVAAAFDGAEALQLFRPSEHDVVVTDVAMPLMNGWELIAELHSRVPGLPVVLVTGYGSSNWNAAFLQKQGVYARLNKPLDIGEFVRILRRLAEQGKSRAA